MSAKSLILYLTFHKLSRAHQPVRVFVIPPGRLQKHRLATLWIRVDLFDGDTDQALSAAAPQESETVLGTIAL